MHEVVLGHPWFDKLTMTNCHPEPVEGWIPALRTAGMALFFGSYFRVDENLFGNEHFMDGRYLDSCKERFLSLKQKNIRPDKRPRGCDDFFEKA